MTLDLEALKRDREAGTPGPWDVSNGMQTRPVEVAGCLLAHFSRDPDGPTHRAANTRRIARVPDLEAAALRAAEIERAADELADRLDAKLRLCCGGTEKDRAALAAYRKAKEADQ